MATAIALIKLAAMSPGLLAAGEVPGKNREEHRRPQLGGGRKHGG